MAVSLFDTRTMLQALEQMFPAVAFLLDMFFRAEEKSMTKYVDIDIVKGNRKLAPFVRPIDKGKVVERLGYSTKSFEPPYIKSKMKTTAQDFLQRSPGNIMYLGSSPAQRAAEQLGKDLKYLQDACIRTEEQMASQLLTTGKVVVVGDGINAEVDFGMAGDHKPTASPLWDNGSADPLNDLRTWVRKVSQDSGIVPDVSVMGFDAVSEFLDNTKVQKLLDLRRVDIGEINPRALPQGASFVGTLRLPGLTIDIYSYDESYTDTNGNLQYFVDPKKVIVGSTRARTARHYAAIQDLKAGLAPVRWFPKTFEEDDPSVLWLLLQSAPLPCLHQVDAFACATVLS